jgi:hypothetical protein
MVLLGRAVDEVRAKWEAEKQARRAEEHARRVCRDSPFATMSYEHAHKGTPCPGCGRSWNADDGDTDHQAFRAAHADCDATWNYIESMGGGGGRSSTNLHCGRCCGRALANPQAREKAWRLLLDVHNRRVAPGRNDIVTNTPAGPRKKSRAELEKELAATQRRMARLEAARADARDGN